MKNIQPNQQCYQFFYEKKYLISFESNFHLKFYIIIIIIAEADMSPALEELKYLVLTHSLEYWDSIENGTAILNALQSLLKVSKCRSNGDAINVSTSLQNEMDTMLKESGNEFCTPAQSISTVSSTDVELSEDDGSDETFRTADEGYDVR